MTLTFNGTELHPEDDLWLATLEHSWKTKQRISCNCTHHMPRMYVARIADQYIVKRMPGTGHLHDPSCTSYMPPEGISGLGQVMDSAIEHSELEDLTYLKLDFPLSQTGKRPQMPPPSGNGATEAESPPRKLTITGLLHYLWDEADLTKWTPGMAGKRWWGTVQYHLRQAADGLIAKGNPIASRLYIPRAFKPELKAELAGERLEAFGKIRNTGGNKTEFGLIIAEYKGHEPAKFGSKFMFKHIPDCGFFAEADLVKRFERIFEEQIELISMTDGAHLIVIATYAMTKSGFPSLQKIAAMPVTRNWIPFENSNDHMLLDHLTEEKRQFVRPLRYNLTAKAQIASALLTDTEEPTALFIADQLPEHILEEPYPSWAWSGDSAFPVLPLKRLSREDHEEQEYRAMQNHYNRKER